MVTANDKIMVVFSQANLYNPSLQKCSYSFGLLFYFVLLKLKLSKKRKTGTSHIKWVEFGENVRAYFPQ